jgi:hypothetical protein
VGELVEPDAVAGVDDRRVVGLAGSEADLAARDQLTAADDGMTGWRALGAGAV